jgi:hypothetical protein
MASADTPIRCAGNSSAATAMTAQLGLGSLAGSFARPAPLRLCAVRLMPMRYFELAGRVVARR